MDAAYEDEVFVDDRTIDSHVSDCARNFGPPTIASILIETLYGVGYRIKEFLKRLDHRLVDPRLVAEAVH